MTLVAPGSIPLSPPVNLRDLAGIPVESGLVRAGFALRADDLSLSDERSVADLVSAGVRTVIDLRSADEVALTGRGPFGAHAVVNYHHVPFMASIGDAARTDAASRADALDQSRFADLYVRMFEGAATQIVAALAIVAYSPGGSAFHCAAGQDRTGVLAAALLLALGADDDVIVADYVRTGENSAAIMARIAPVMAPLMAAHGMTLDESARAAIRTEFSPAPMRELLATLRQRHGDPLTPLRLAGLDDDLVARLRDRAALA